MEDKSLFQRLKEISFSLVVLPVGVVVIIFYTLYKTQSIWTATRKHSRRNGLVSGKK
jgi:hypothetical protein